MGPGLCYCSPNGTSGMVKLLDGIAEILKKCLDQVGMTRPDKIPESNMSRKEKNMNRKLIILLGDDDPGEMDPSVAESLKRRGISILTCTNGIELVRRAVMKKPDVVVINVALGKLNGYQCARLLRHEAVTRQTPIIHMGTSHSPVDSYWSRVCGGDVYLEIPFDAEMLHKTVSGLLAGRESRLANPIAGGSILSEMGDHAVLGLATNLLEQDLLRLNILKEINMVDTTGNSPGELISSLFAILNSLCPFSFGGVLLIYEERVEFFHCSSKGARTTSAEIKSFLRDELQRRQDDHINVNDIVDISIASEISDLPPEAHSEISVHVGDAQLPVQTAMAFERIDSKDRTRDEESLFYLALDLIRGVIEKKIIFRINQELSVIDIATRGYSITFLMEVLGREMENATRHNYVISLFTLRVANFSILTAEMDNEQLKGFIKSVQGSIRRSMRKTDVVARWNQANFAFLLTHTALEGTREAIVRVKKNLMTDISKIGVDVKRLRLEIGLCQFNPDRDKTPELFLKYAMPPSKKKRAGAVR